MKPIPFGIFTRTLSELDFVCNCIPPKNMLSFFSDPHARVVAQASSIRLSEIQPIPASALNNDDFKSTFADRHELFFNLIEHAVIFARPLDPLVITLIFSAITALEDRAIKFVTVLSDVDVSPLLTSTSEIKYKLKEWQLTGAVKIHSGGDDSLFLPSRLN